MHTTTDHNDDDEEKNKKFTKVVGEDGHDYLCRKQFDDDNDNDDDVKKFAILNEITIFIKRRPQSLIASSQS